MMAIISKNIKTILTCVAILIILYGAYNTLFTNVEGLGKKKLSKICDDISNCGGYDFNDKNERKAFKRVLNTEKRICKRECKNNYENLGFSNRNKCRKNYCKPEVIAVKLVKPISKSKRKPPQRTIKLSFIDNFTVKISNTLTSFTYFPPDIEFQKQKFIHEDIIRYNGIFSKEYDSEIKNLSSDFNLHDRTITFNILHHQKEKNEKPLQLVFSGDDIYQFMITGGELTKYERILESIGIKNPKVTFFSNN